MVYAHNTSDGCAGWVPTLPELPHDALWVNAALYTALLALMLALALASCVRSERAPVAFRRPLRSALILCFAALRVGWAAYVVAPLSERRHTPERLVEGGRPLYDQRTAAGTTFWV